MAIVGCEWVNIGTSGNPSNKAYQRLQGQRVLEAMAKVPKSVKENFREGEQGPENKFSLVWKEKIAMSRKLLSSKDEVLKLAFLHAPWILIEKIIYGPNI